MSYTQSLFNLNGVEVNEDLPTTLSNLRIFKLEEDNRILTDKVIELEQRNLELEDQIAHLQLQTNVTKRKKSVSLVLTASTPTLEERVSLLEKRLNEQLLVAPVPELTPVPPVAAEVTVTPSPAVQPPSAGTNKKKKRKKRNRSQVPRDPGAAEGESKSCCKAVIWGDSMIRKVRLPAAQLRKKCFPGASVASMTDLLRSCDDGLNPEAVVIHVGTNSLRLATTASGQPSASSHSFRKELETMMTAARCLYPAQRIILSGVIFRRGYSDEGINRVNEAMEEITKSFPNCRFVDANPWLGPTCLSRDGLHLNEEGARRFGDLLKRILTPKGNE